MSIPTFLNLKQKLHRTHLAGWQKLGLMSPQVITSKGRVTGVDLTIGSPLQSFIKGKCRFAGGARVPHGRYDS